MKKKIVARAALATGMAAGLVLSSAVGAMASADAGTTLPVKNQNIRVWGPTRAETSVQATEHVRKDNAAVKTATKENVFVVGGDAYADTLALTPLSDCMDSSVLMTRKADVLTDSVRDELIRLKPAHVTIIGGPVAVSDGVKAEIQAALPKAKVSRIAGPTRFETAVDVAAFATACYAQDPALFAGLDKVYGLEKAEADYQAALANYEKARKAYAAEMAKLEALTDRAAALQDQITNLVKQIKPVGNLAELKADVAAAQGAVDAANEELGKQLDANKFLTEVVSNNLVTASTLDISSTVDEYKALFAAKDKALLKKYTDAVEAVGGTGTDMQKDIIGMSNAKVKSAQADVASASTDYSNAVLKLFTALANDEANASIKKQIADVTKQLNDVLEQITAQTDKVIDAQTAMDDAQKALVKATKNRPAPGEIDTAKKALRKAIADQIAASGKYNVFLADGNNFPDALAGGAAAAHDNGVVLLTAGATLPAATDGYLAKAKSQVVTVGGPATTAVKDHVIDLKAKFVGADRYETAALVTKYYFGMNTNANHHGPLNKHPLAIASGEDFADAVLASNFIAQYDGGVLLTKKNEVPIATLNYLDNFSKRGLAIRVIGGQVPVSDKVMSTLIKYTK